jgi:hypothetical protein
MILTSVNKKNLFASKNMEICNILSGGMSSYVRVRMSFPVKRPFTTKVSDIWLRNFCDDSPNIIFRATVYPVSLRLKEQIIVPVILRLFKIINSYTCIYFTYTQRSRILVPGEFQSAWFRENPPSHRNTDELTWNSSQPNKSWDLRSVWSWWIFDNLKVLTQ